MLETTIKSSVENLIQNGARVDIRRHYAFPMKGRVEKVYTEAGKYLADVQPQRNGGGDYEVPDPVDGSKKIKLPVIKEIPIDCLCNGPRRGLFCLPQTGSLVRVSFYGGDWTFPFIDAVLWGEGETPEIDEHGIHIFRDETTSIRMMEDGTINIDTLAPVNITAGEDVTVTTAADAIVTASNVSIDCQTASIGSGAIKGVARLGDPVEVSPSTHKGTITGASSSVTCK